MSGTTADMAQNRLPVVTVGGYLGSGKTTLINWMLGLADNRRVVVFVNDFGDINIDFDLIETVVEDRISLKNGCVCCTLNDDLITGIAEFARSVEPPDVVVIETSGVADPRALDASISSLEAAGLARLDARVYLVDALGFDQCGYEDQELIIDCAAASDLVLLNKVDLANNTQITEVKSVLAEAAPHSALIETVNCGIDVDLIFSPQLDKNPSQLTEIRRSEWNAKHSERYQKWSGRTGHSLNRESFEYFAGQLAESCIRAKGMVRFADQDDSLYVFHMASKRATLEPMKHDLSDAASRLIVIAEQGKINSNELEQMFYATIHH